MEASTDSLAENAEKKEVEKPAVKPLPKIFCWVCILVHALISFPLYFALTPGHQFSTRGEAREALVIQAFSLQQNFILPLRGGLDIPSKPPMLHWLSYLTNWMSPELSSLGNEAGYRTAPILLGCLGVSIFFAFALLYRRRLFVPLGASLVLGTTVAWLQSATHLRVDICFAVFSITAVLFLARAVSSTKNRWYLVASLALAGAGLTKGPAGLVLPVVIVCLAQVLSGEVKAFIKKLPTFIGFVSLAAVLLAAWYFTAYLFQGKEFLYTQLFKENIARLVSVDGVNPGHRKSLFVLITQLFVAWIPWVFLLPLVLSFLVSKRKSFTLPASLMIFRGRLDLSLAASAIAVFSLIILISISKRPVYLLPAYPAIAYLLLLVLERIKDASPAEFSSARRWHRLTFEILSALCCILTVLFSFVSLLGFDLFKSVLSPFVEQASTLSFWLDRLFLPEMLKGEILLFLSLALVCWWFSGLRRFGVLLLAISSYLASLWSVFNILPIIEERSAPKAFAEQTNSLVPATCKLVQIGSNFYGMSYYMQRPIISYEAGETSFAPGPFLLLRRKDSARQLGMIDPDGVLYPTEPLAESSNFAANGKDVLQLFAPRSAVCETAEVVTEAEPPKASKEIELKD